MLICAADSASDPTQPVTPGGAAAKSGAGDTTPTLIRSATGDSDFILPTVLGLEAAQRIAVQRSPTLRMAQARAREARARVRIANATFWPRVQIDGSWAHTRLPDSWREAYDERNPFPITTTIEGNYRATLTRDGSVTVPEPWKTFWETFPPPEPWAVFWDDLTNPSFTLDQSFSSTLTWDPEIPEFDQEFPAYGAGIRASWLLFDGFSRLFNRASARHAETETLAAQQDAKRLIIGAVAKAYYQAQLAREEIAIAQAELEFYARLVGDAEARHNAGERPLSDVLNFRVRKNVAETSLLANRRLYQSNLIGLAALIGEPDAQFPSTTSLAPLDPARDEELDPPDVVPMIVHAMQYRPDLRATRAAVERTTANVKAAKAEFSPSLRFLGNYDALRKDDMEFSEDDFGWSVGLVLGFDLFRGGDRLANVAQHKASRDAALARTTQAEINTAAEVRDAAQSLVSAGDQFRVQRRTVDLVERNRDLVEKEYGAGRASLVRLNEAQRDLVEAQSRYAAALASLHVAWHHLQQSTALSLNGVAGP